jgi:hypothetical protein
MRKLIIIAAVVLLSGSVEARDRKQVTLFRSRNPCPATGQTKGPCHGYVVDHRVPLCLGGEDSPANMQWQELEASKIKDKTERQDCALKRKGVNNVRAN